jgi:hypothetical protein
MVRLAYGKTRNLGRSFLCETSCAVHRFDLSVQKEAWQLMLAATAVAVATRGDENDPQTIYPVTGVDPEMQAVFGALCFVCCVVRIHDDCQHG